MSRDPSSLLDLDECIEHLRALIRIPSVNPPGVPEAAAGHDSAGAERAAAEYCADALEAAGIGTEVVEIEPGRGSCIARLPASVADPEAPLILLSHLDVVPVDAESWSRDPFGGELVDGEVWGRGAVDMKDMVAMELAVMLALKRSGAPLRRDVIFAAVADEEAGGEFGARGLVERRPDLFRDAQDRPADAALNEVGGYSMTLGGKRFYTLQVAEKGIVWTRLRATGSPGHASMPHTDNAAVKLARAVAALADDQAGRRAVVTPLVAEMLEAIGLGEVAELATSDPDAARAILEQSVADPIVRRSLDAMLRDTVTPTILRSGKKVNVMPGSGEAELDVRTLPGTDQEALLMHLRDVVGADAEVEPVVALPAIEWPANAPIVDHMRDALTRADPDGIPLPMMITPGTDAKALAQLGIPCYGFAPLRLEADFPFLELFHGHDERVPVSAIAFGLPVLFDVVRSYVAD